MASNGKTSAAKRLQSELHDLIMADLDGVSAYPQDDNLFHWVGTVDGVPDTPYEGTSFQLLLKFPDDYPYQPPTVSFITPCFHPNVDVHGTICLDILQEKWSPVQSASSVLLSIQTLLNDPNNASPLNAAAAQLWDDKEEFRKAVIRFQPASTA